MYIEDFFKRGKLTAEERRDLRDVVSCPYLPTKARYLADLQEAGFGDIQFDDVSALWAAFTAERAAAYKAAAAPIASLDTFYSTVASLFAAGRLGGARITCTPVNMSDDCCRKNKTRPPCGMGNTAQAKAVLILVHSPIDPS
jgi:hypothetical protein